jgi:hypothetical protein
MRESLIVKTTVFCKLKIYLFIISQKIGLSSYQFGEMVRVRQMRKMKVKEELFGI